MTTLSSTGAVEFTPLGQSPFPDLESTLVPSGVFPLLGDDSDNLLDGTGEREAIDGRGGDDTLNGGGGDDLIFGGDGDDIISGGKGDDIIDGGNGNDVMVGNGGADLFIGGLGNDTINGGSGSARDVLSYEFSTSAIFVNIGSRFVSSEDYRDSVVNIQAVIGTDFDDTMLGDRRLNELFGGDGDDDLDGRGGNDTLDGGDGNDVIKGGSGNDVIRGGRGDDEIDGGTGFDIVSFEDADAGVFVLLDAPDSTLITIDEAGQVVSEEVIERDGISISFGGTAGLDSIVNVEGVIGSNFGDSISGDSVGNSLSGAAGNDFVNGGAGDDTLDGGLGNDVLNGGVGNDIIAGGEGQNLLTGGAGADVFLFDEARGHSTTITDFEDGVDLIQLTGLATDASDLSITETEAGDAVITLTGDAAWGEIVVSDAAGLIGVDDFLF